MKLFLSWSKDRSKKMAEALHSWMPVTLSAIDTWFSEDPSCLPKGQNFPTNILNHAVDSDACLVIITKENIDSAWINFEAGLFFGMKKPVFALLCGDVDYKVLAQKNFPLSANGMNYTSMTYEEIKNTFISINELMPINKRQKISNLERAVLVNYPHISKQYNEIFNADSDDFSKNLAALDEDQSIE